MLTHTVVQFSIQIDLLHTIYILYVIYILLHSSQWVQFDSNVKIYQQTPQYQSYPERKSSRKASLKAIDQGHEFTIFTGSLV